MDYLRQHETFAVGDQIALSQGDEHDVQGGTNTLKILEVA
jgi:pyruvate kinase